MDMSLPSPTRIAHRISELHNQVSPNGMFGFPVLTFEGVAPHPNEWEQSWTVFFRRLFRESIDLDSHANVIWPEMLRTAEHLCTVVIPRLLDPLQQGLEPIVPCLIHGDLWGGNMGTDKETGALLFFDAGSFFAHNEMDVAIWRGNNAQNLGPTYLDEYKKVFPPSEPQDEFDDRNRLYSIKYDLNLSAAHLGEKSRDVYVNACNLSIFYRLIF